MPWGDAGYPGVRPAILRFYRNGELLITAEPATRTNVALAASGATASAQNYTQDGVIANAHFQPSFANDGQRYAHLTATDADGFWRDEHGLPSWLQEYPETWNVSPHH